MPLKLDSGQGRSLRCSTSLLVIFWQTFQWFLFCLGSTLRIQRSPREGEHCALHEGAEPATQSPGIAGNR